MVLHSDETLKVLLTERKENKIFSATRYVKVEGDFFANRSIFEIIKNRGKKVDLRNIDTGKILRRVNKNYIRGLNRLEIQEMKEKGLID